jgi:hypothetical protein
MGWQTALAPPTLSLSNHVPESGHEHRTLSARELVVIVILAIGLDWLTP